MQNKTILVTGANGEVGHLLLPEVKKQNPKKIITLDINNLDDDLKQFSDEIIKGSVADQQILDKIFSENKIDIVFHLASILSTHAEREPQKAFEVNVNGTNMLLDEAVKSKNILFFFPSSIAAYGLPNIESESQNVLEDQFSEPITLYGIHKRFAELMGTYHDKNSNLDFRCLRFPGLISADTLPSGGTTDFGPEMLHKLAQKQDYECYVREDTKLPFMIMPDAIKAILNIVNTEKNNLMQNVYNVTSFSVTAKEIESESRKFFDNSAITYKSDNMRQKIADSWPASIDDSAARNDFNWKPEYNFEKSFEDYLVPSVRKRYS